MANSQLQVAFLWHMHQPYYKDPDTGLYSLPWVRLHGVKDYLDMLLILQDFPALKQNFNLVPSLLMQLLDYTENSAQDRHMELTLRHASDLTEQDLIFITENFFLANWDNMIKPFPRYYEILTMRGFRYSKTDIHRVIKYFRQEDIRDLQLLFNLAWIDPLFREQDSDLAELVKKGRNFSEEDKQLVISKQMDILRRIVPQYKSMWDSGQIEVSFTPFYHPILPLLCDTDIARVGMPGVNLPKQRFSFPQDADAQIKSALQYSEQLFGQRPEGMWPSEGSVSDEVLAIMRANGIKWAATDEAVLANSLGRLLRDDNGSACDAPAMYRNYRCNDVSLFFRDHKLSDQIGFVYSGWNAHDAVADLMNRLIEIKKCLPSGESLIVPIILDGENAWEHYRNDGRDFLNLLYKTLNADPGFRSVTFSEFIAENGTGQRLEKIFPGSWINSNFGIWIGHQEDNTSWDYLTRTRTDIDAYEKAHPDIDTSEARQHLYAAEGSDWNWWYGDEHCTETAEVFDELYRKSLMAVYKCIGIEPPAHLYVPVLSQDREVKPEAGIRGFIHPNIDGLVTSYFEWHTAAWLDVKQSGGSMHRSESTFVKIYYGFNKDNLYIRLDPSEPFSEMIKQEPMSININITSPSECRASCTISEKTVQCILYRKKASGLESSATSITAAAQDIFEIELPFSEIEASVDDLLNFSIEISRTNGSSERLPSRGHMSLFVPVAHYEDLMWY